MGKIRQLVPAWSSQSAHNHHGDQVTANLSGDCGPARGRVFYKEYSVIIDVVNIVGLKGQCHPGCRRVERAPG